MPKTNEHRIYENNSILKQTLSKVIFSLKNITDRIIFINIMYSDGRSGNTPYPGMKYIMDLRGKHKNTTPVLFYGFENLERLKKKPEASILDSPAIEYIRIPFLINELSEKIQKISTWGIIRDGLDEQTRKKIALEKISTFKHDIINAARTIEIVFKLKRKGTAEIQKENWNIVRKSLFTPEAKNQINKNIILFENIKYAINELFPKSKIIKMKNNLSDAENIYTTLIKRFSEYSEQNKIKAISDAEATINLLNEIITTLEVK